MIEIVNLHGRKLAADEVYIGRKSRDLQGSPLGNPFPVSMGREECIREYRAWLWAQMQDPASDVSIELSRLVVLYRQTGALKLACWCHPLPCHGDVVAAAIRWLAAKEAARE